MEVRKRLDVIRDFPMLEAARSAELLAKTIIASGIIPPQADWSDW